ncbi:MAG: C25 family cysteine peptidase [Candidatus Eisenbacteria bacterium]
MRRIALLCLLSGLLIHSPLFGDDVTGVSPEKAPVVDLVSSNGNGITLLFELPELLMESITLGGMEFQAAAIPGGGAMGGVGEPAIPTYARLLAVPEGATVRVNSTRLEEETFTGVHLLPVQDGRESEPNEFMYDAAAYSAMRMDDGVDVVVGSPAYLRDLRVMNLDFRPVHYDPASRTMKVARRIEVEIEFEGAAPEKASLPTTVPPSFYEMYRALVVNYDDAAPLTTVAPGTILMITQNNAAVIDSVQKYIEWRTRKGYPVTHVTTAQTGTSANQIKSYIQSVYNDPNVDLEYVVLVGDVSQIPTFFETLSGYDGEGDLPYSQLVGGDALPDVHLGRLSYGTMAELGVIIQKSVYYESDPEMRNTGWFTRGCVIGDPSSSGYSCIETQRWLRNHLWNIGYTEVDSIFSATFVTKMLTALGKGDTVMGYRGYYNMSGWSNGYVSAINNGWKLPYCVIITCDTGSFASGTSRAEGFLRGGAIVADSIPSAVPEGGIGAIGMATLGTHTRYNNCMFYGIFHGLIQENLHTMGASASRGKVEMALNYGSNEPNAVTIWAHWANLMGDPVIDVWTAVPGPITVTHRASVAIAENSMIVTVEDITLPIEGALVCLWKGSETYVTGYTDENGLVELPLTNVTAGSMYLTVTKHNLHPYLATVNVSAGDHVGYAAATIDDDGSGGSSGNGDGVINPNETIELPVQLRNFGGSSVSGVTATLTESDPFVTITDNAESFGTIGSGGTAWSAEDFDIVVAPGCPDGHVLRLGLDATNGVDDWHSLIELDVVSAELLYQSRTFYNDGGNGLDPGETVDLAVTVYNSGGVAAGSMTGTLVSQSSYVSVGDAQGTFGTIGTGGTGNNSGDRFTVSASSNVYEGYSASMLLIAQFDGGRIDTIPFGLTVGQVSNNDPTGPDAYGYLAYENVDTAYPEAPTYSWIELDPAYGGSGGTHVNLDYAGDDYGVNEVLTLPFTFNYYGRSYDQVTVCSNGWIAMGVSESFSYRNWTIPGAGGPDAMIAPFWDDLYTTTSAPASQAYYKYEAVNHRWIFEWSRYRNAVGGAVETFEVILYDPAFHTTDTGDGMIEFQYQQVTNYDPTEGYATVGIESPDQLDGILITYWNRYSAGATTLAAGRAIRFLPMLETAYGFLSGTVRNTSYNNTPVAGAMVEVLGTGRSFPSGADGTFSGSVAPGTYTVVASRAGFEPDTVAGVSITESQMTIQDFGLVDNAGPIVTVTPHEDTDDVTGPYVIPVTIEEFSGLPQRRIHYRTNWNAELLTVQLDSIGPGQFQGEIPGQPYTSIVEYFVYARDGLDQITIDPPGAPFDMHRFIVSQIAIVVDDDFETNNGWTLGVAGDDATTGVWIHADPVGTDYSGSEVQPEDDHTPDPGTICFVTGNGAVGGAAGDNDVDGRQTTLLSPVFDLTGYSLASLSYAVWYTNSYGSSPNSDIWNVQVTDNGSTWKNLEYTTASTNAWVVRSFALDDTISLTNQVRFRFIASDDANGSLVEAAVDDILITATNDYATGIAEGSPEVPLAFGLEPGRPNPFNPRTTIGFSMPTEGRALIRVYDIAGREVATLINATVPAGRHEVLWDGKNGSGRDVTSGIYFVRFEASGFLQVRQITLVR